MEVIEALIEKVSSIESNIQKDLKDLRGLKSEIKKLKKHIKKPRADRKGQTVPSGFNKPGPISKELAKFLGVDNGTDVARTEVTKKMSEYIKSKNLQNSENKREFVVDDKLAKLLGLKKGTSLKYFGLQSHLKVHYLPRVEASTKA